MDVFFQRRLCENKGPAIFTYIFDFKFHVEYSHLKAGESQECLSRADPHNRTLTHE